MAAELHIRAEMVPVRSQSREDALVNSALGALTPVIKQVTVGGVTGWFVRSNDYTCGTVWLSECGVSMLRLTCSRAIPASSRHNARNRAIIQAPPA